MKTGDRTRLQAHLNLIRDMPERVRLLQENIFFMYSCAVFSSDMRPQTKEKFGDHLLNLYKNELKEGVYYEFI